MTATPSTSAPATELLADARRILERIGPVSVTLRLLLAARTELSDDLPQALSVVNNELDQMHVSALEWETAPQAALPDAVPPEET
jgi:hypothetical protein